MKLKFKAELRDIVIFIVYSIFLFFLVAIAVVNIASFASDATFSGLNPFPAFTSGLFAPTMVFWLAGLIASFTGVSSYFFEREKGIGVQVGAKKEKGYSRWAEDKEFKKQLVKILPTDEHADKVGIPLINNGKEIWVDAEGYHNMIIGSTGSGKSQSLSFPFIRVMAKGGESMIVTDPKGELYEKTANELKERGYNIIVLNFRNPQNGNCWNPFTLPYKLYKNGDIDKATELLEDLAKNILYDESSKGQDPFWENTSADYFTGLSLALFEDAAEEEININSINIMSTVGEEKLGGTTYIKEYFSDKDQTGGAYVNASSTLMAPTDTKGSILSVFKQKIKMFSSRENLSEMLSHSDFDLEDIGRKKTAVFIVIQDEKKTYHPLVTIFLKQCYETLVRVAQETGGKLKYRTNFLLDEFANMPPLTDVDAMVSAARSRNIKLSFIIQNFSQLNDVYGKEKAETIRGNCGNTIYLLSTELAALEEISKMCGEVKSKKDDKTDSRPLVTVSDLQKLKEEEAIILRSRMNPYKTKLKFDYKIDWGTNYPKASYPKREKEKVRTFDLKKYVSEKRDKKINELLGNGMTPPKPSGNPFMGGMPGMPVGNIFDGVKQPGGFNVDDIVKRIDAKIAELEAEEAAEKAKQSDKTVNKKATEKPVETKVEEKKFKREEITDDQFFDDFFNDEDDY
ncbi:MAG: type IV secretory system conjugative DNA transfer family protein [Bacilli bacterium]|nr:type IV secretory system conjugative DNA transfer family protein [Bacilli bacterium]